MTRYVFRLPDIGEGIAEAEIVAWHVMVGDVVAEDQAIADMMTDKATVEMETPVAGTIVALAGEAGDRVAIGAMLVTLEVDDQISGDQMPDGELPAAALSDESTPGGAISGKAVPDEAHPGELSSSPGDTTRPIDTSDPVHTPTPPISHPALPEVAQSDARHRGEVNWKRKASSPAEHSAKGSPPPLLTSARPRALAAPAVRARAASLGVDLAEIAVGAEAGGRVRHGDLDAFLAYNRSQGFKPAHHSAARADEMIKVIGLRRRIAENMAASKRHIPHFTYVEEIDVTLLEAMRGDLNGARIDSQVQDRQIPPRSKLTLLPLLITAICKALPAFPMINARYDDESGMVTRHGSVHLGIATQTDAGLMVPVIREAQDLNIWQLASEIARLAEAARNGSAKAHELSGSTLTVTSLGPLGGIATTPVINRPEVAIIGPNRIVERPIVRDGELAVGKLMNLSISCDHRVVDGWDAASFVQALKRLLETPVLLFAPD